MHAYAGRAPDSPLQPQVGSAPRRAVYELEAGPFDRVLGLLRRIWQELDRTLAFRHSCGHGVCGSDAMLIDGRNHSPARPWCGASEGESRWHRFRLSRWSRISAIVAAHRFLFDSRDQATEQRLRLMDRPYGVWSCRTIQNCTQACPRGIDVARAILEVKRLAVQYRLRGRGRVP